MKMNWKKKSPIRYANKKAPACVKGIHPSLSLSCPMVPGVWTEPPHPAQLRPPACACRCRLAPFMQLRASASTRDLARHQASSLHQSTTFYFGAFVSGAGLIDIMTSNPGFLKNPLLLLYLQSVPLQAYLSLRGKHSWKLEILVLLSACLFPFVVD